MAELYVDMNKIIMFYQSSLLTNNSLVLSFVTFASGYSTVQMIPAHHFPQLEGFALLNVKKCQEISEFSMSCHSASLMCHWVIVAQPAGAGMA